MTTRSTGRHAPPKAGAMLEALRGLGYNTATALADILDNSIAAGAGSVAISFAWEGRQSYVTVIDDGCGMTPDELDRAMRLGEKSPLDQRPTHDLGRFGLGLKTASFSQCRRLTVASRRAGEISVLRWDLDVLSARTDDGWYMLEGPADGSEALLQPLETVPNGTLVLWEVMDRIVTPGCTQQTFLDLMDTVERHLAMVFHRFLDGQRLQIRINGRLIKPWDPFLLNHPATWSSPVERLPSPSGPVEVQCHVLPHHDRLEIREHSLAAGPEGWTAQQGFYVYRNRRLLVAGGWLGLGQGKAWTREEAHRLARIRLDIPNTADQEWKIDIRKSTARPPVYLRDPLMRLAEDTRERARRVFAHRGQIIRGAGDGIVTETWQLVQTRNGSRYQISENHPAISSVLADAGDLAPRIRAMLRIIGETVPVQRVWLDTAEGRDVPRTGFNGCDQAEIMQVLQPVYRSYLKKGLSADNARQRLLSMEPFNQYPDLVAALPNTI